MAGRSEQQVSGLEICHDQTSYTLDKSQAFTRIGWPVGNNSIDINVNNLRARRIHTNLNTNSCIRQSQPRHRELVHIQRFADGTRYNSDDRRSPPVEPQVG